MHQQRKILIASLGLGIAVVLSLSTVMGGLLVWGVATAAAVLIIGAAVTIGKMWIEKRTHMELPKCLSSTGFTYSKPDWLSDNDKEQISDMAKAAFVLLAFDRTETGCWSKTYLYRRMAEAEKLPLARGALTGTPFAFIAMTSYAAQAETIVDNWAYPPISETLAKIITEDGSYLKRYTKASLMGMTQAFEPPRHAAGACLLTLMFGIPGSRDMKTLESLCLKRVELGDYDRAMIFRVLTQASHLRSVPNKLRRQIKTRQKEILRDLIESGEKTLSSRIWAQSFGYQQDTTNQWGTVWWLLPSLNIPQLSLKQRQILERVLRQFLLAQSAAEPTGNNLLPSEIDKSGNGIGKHVFGSALALAAWRTLEIDELSTLPRDKEQATTNAKRMFQRIVNSLLEILELPSKHPPDKTESLEGYLGWAGLCLAAASMGINISPDDCQRGLSLAQELDTMNIDDLTEEQLENNYLEIIYRKGFLKPQIAQVVARVASRVALNYKAVPQNEQAA